MPDLGIVNRDKPASGQDHEEANNGHTNGAPGTLRTRYTCSLRLRIVFVNLQSVWLVFGD